MTMMSHSKQETFSFYEQVLDGTLLEKKRKERYDILSQETQKDIEQQKNHFATKKPTDITNDLISLGQKILNAHIVDSTYDAKIESALFCVVSAANTFENAKAFIHKCRYAATQDKTKTTPQWFYETPGFDEVKKSFRFHHTNRLDCISELLKNPTYMQTIGTSDPTMRLYAAKHLPGMSMKTYSMWDLCNGGEDFFVLDIHVRRQLYEYGVDIPVKQRIAHPRLPKDLQRLPKRFADDPRIEEYPGIEQKAKDLFTIDQRFKNNYALVTSILWWVGTQSSRNKVVAPDQNPTLPYTC